MPVLKQKERGLSLMQNGWIRNGVMQWVLDYMQGGWSGLLGNQNQWGKTGGQITKKKLNSKTKSFKVEIFYVTLYTTTTSYYY